MGVLGFLVYFYLLVCVTLYGTCLSLDHQSLLKRSFIRQTSQLPQSLNRFVSPGTTVLIRRVRLPTRTYFRVSTSPV